jgi:hypothetical protein
MVVDAPNPARHTVQLAGHLTALAVFVACTLVGVQSFLLEPRPSPVDGVLWVALVLMALYVCALTVAALVNRPLLGRTVVVDTTMKMVPTGLMITMSLGILVLSIPFQRWFGAAAWALILAGSLYKVGFRPRQATAGRPSPAGPAA